MKYIFTIRYYIMMNGYRIFKFENKILFHDSCIKQNTLMFSFNEKPF